MRSIEELVPRALQADADGLRAVEATRLARWVVDTSQPWWRRTPCAAALAGRVPEEWFAELSARAQDPQDTTEVRIAVLDVLSDRAELLPWLRHEDRRGESGHGMREAVLRARGQLGDRSAAPELATVAFSDSLRSERSGGSGLDALVERYGVEAIRADLGVARPEDRAAHLRLRAGAGEDVADVLADPDPRVAFAAQEYMTDPGRVRAYLAEAPTVDAKLWAAFALYRLTEDLDETRALYATLGSPRVEVPGLDEDVRRAIVHAYAPWGCTRGTDPRWRLEAVCTEPPAPVDQEAQLRRAVAALTAAGLAPQAPVPVGEYNQQGDGTYHVILCGETEVFVSTLGPFVTVTAGDESPAREALRSAGLRWIDPWDTTQVTGLHVYYFGGRAPRSVDTLLFHWQD
ncbi:hypothetical protein [Streptomyces sp. NPDC056600]|uniref:hypothetical protein n=1 Tax=Streptomyces sp. NPDC056600 TaxID=3345874 RepID=UPI0036C67691